MNRAALALVAMTAACGGPPRTARVPVEIPPGTTLQAAVDSLAAHAVVRHPSLFLAYARARGLRGELKSGDYLLPEGARWNDIVAALTRGRGIEVRWTVPEGLMLPEVAALAETELGIPRDSFLAAAGDPALRQALALPTGSATVEGYLFPTTYVLPVHIGARELVQVMTRAFQDAWQADWQNRLDSLHWTRHQAVTLASIIEAEVRYDPDRPFVSAVYHNRLARGMKLEADPTVIYAFGHRLKRVWDKDLLIASPYNTYLHPGLPPGPIAEPGRASLLAALNPAPFPFLYFVAQPDGKHIFSVTLPEHEAAVRTVKRLQAAGREPQPRDPAHPTLRP